MEGAGALETNEMPSVTFAEKTKTLNRRRGSYKAKITKLQSFLKDKASNAEQLLLRSKLDKVSEMYSSMEALKIEYYEVVEDEQLPNLEFILEEMEDDLEEIKVGLQTLLLKHDISKNVSICNTALSNNGNSPKSSFIKLPDISLPEFHGVIENWSDFKRQFDSLITNNSVLNDTQKLFYLRSALKCEARTIETSEDTFDSLMTVLIKRYENKRVIINSHIMNILNFEKLCIESSKGLRNLIDVINKNLRGLKLMDLETNELTHQFLINIIIRKLDIESRKLYEMSLTSTELPKWEMFLEFLQNRTQILENWHGVQGPPLKLKTPFLSKGKSFIVKSNNNNNCLLCKTSHRLYDCTLFLKMNPLQRFNLIKKHGLCINCLNNNHKVALCKSKYTCRLCRGKHNYLLCRSVNGQSDTEGSSSNTLFTQPAPSVAPTSNNGGVINNPTQPQTVQAFSSLNQRGNKFVFLSTAIVGVWSALLKSYVAVGITDFVPSIQPNLKIKRFNDINRSILADPSFDKPGKIDMIIGAELFYQILKDGRKVISDNVTLINSVFGFIVSGSVNAINHKRSRYDFVPGSSFADSSIVPGSSVADSSCVPGSSVPDSSFVSGFILAPALQFPRLGFCPAPFRFCVCSSIVLPSGLKKFSDLAVLRQ
ncbi:integrase catalytic domain-containing protein [Trichonephila clavata]|uniref:Integrase catalytic domain-containing protein n=1 Tax=Trichonephila clavata TaxID=2740835 RepID=A0A8X6LGU6_TRICU|nr:integrase catalytic domain-containing protein [Trichonephila clavata]